MKEVLALQGLMRGLYINTFIGRIAKLFYWCNVIQTISGIYLGRINNYSVT